VVNALALGALLAVNAFVPTLQTGDTLPPLPLVDQNGHAFSLAHVRGNAVVLTFIYTRCADARMCPLASLKFARLQRLIGDAPIRLVELTLDPQFDTPRVLRRYGAAYGADPRRWTLATGAPASLTDLATRLGIASAWTAPGTLAHTEATVVLDRTSAIATEVAGNAWTPEAMLALARTAAGERSTPLASASTWLTAAIERCGGGSLPISALGLIALIGALSLAFGVGLARACRPALRRERP
jgi:cytochrome oxidase Cu insertion factor (SCO1/SenC/PrrC family)